MMVVDKLSRSSAKNSGYNSNYGVVDTLIIYFYYQEYILLPHARAAAA